MTGADHGDSSREIVRVFPRRTSYTPTDSLAFVGDPPLWRPEGIAQIMVSVTFTWDVPEARRLAEAWGSCYPGVPVHLGGPALNSRADGFVAGRFVKPGVTFTSRGCDNRCPWCLVPAREGRLRMLPDFPDGHVINDNNFLQCSPEHRRKVYAMLDRQPRAAVFAGGLDARLVTDEVAAELRSIPIGQIFLAADTDESLPALEQALNRLSFLGRDKLRAYVLCGWNGQTIDQAQARLEAVWEMGAMPFAQLYQPADRWIAYSGDWKRLQRMWSRPALMKVRHRGRGRPEDSPIFALGLS